MKETILIVEDERTIADTVVYALEREGFAPHWAATGAEGLDFVRQQEPALVVLDIGLPDINGLDLCRQIRQFSAIPLIFLTARTEEVDKILGLELGGDDYVTKPFSPRELVARVRSVLRRHHLANQTPVPPSPPAPAESTPSPATEGEEVRVIGEFSEDTERMRISFRGEPLDLSLHEYRLLSLLLGRPGKVFSRDEILDRAWDEPTMTTDRTVDAHIKAIRKKLKLVDESANPIRTVRGVGYAIEQEV